MTRLAALAFLTVLAPLAFAGGFVTPVLVPELDGTGVLGAIGLLAGVIAVTVEIRRRK